MKRILPIIITAALIFTGICPIGAAALPDDSADQAVSGTQSTDASNGSGEGTVSGLLNADGEAAQEVDGLLLAAESAVLINAKTGQILYEKNKDKQLFPASTTKVMTALLTLENKSLDEVVTISHDASFTEGSRIYLLEGEQMTIEQLLYAMMLESANDAAIALAEAVGGSVSAFADMMNARADELGAKNTHFETPNGLPNDAHVTSAYDLAIIAQEAMKNETFRKIVSTESYNIPPTELQAETRYLHNTNKLLASTSKVYIDGVKRECKYDGILGIKTGYTKAAQSCLVAGAERDGMEVIGVILRSTPDSQYPDMIKLLDNGFNKYEAVKLVSAGDEVGSISVQSGASGSVKLVVNEDIYASALKEGGTDTSDLEPAFEIDAEPMTAPVEAGAEAGTVKVMLGDTDLGTYKVYAAENVEVSSFKNILNTFAKVKNIHIPAIVFIIVIIAVLAVLYMRFVMKVRRENEIAKQKRREMREQRRLQSEREEARLNGTGDDDILKEYYRSKASTAARLRSEENEKNLWNRDI